MSRPSFDSSPSFSYTAAMAMMTLTTPQVEQYAAVLTRYPLYESIDDDEEWDKEFYHSRRKIPSPALPPLPLGHSQDSALVLLALLLTL